MEITHKHISTWNFSDNYISNTVTKENDGQLSCSCPDYIFLGDCLHVRCVNQEETINVLKKRR